MVRISPSAPSDCDRLELKYEERYFKVPAACISDSRRENITQVLLYSEGFHEVPIPSVAVPLDQAFAARGNGVVSQRTANHVGFNGHAFRSANGHLELRNSSPDTVQRAWPAGLRQPYSILESREPVYGMEILKCAPENWIQRRTVNHFGNDRERKARYPPRNLFNAKFGLGPRSEEAWSPTSTYEEPPFLLIEGTAALNAMKSLALKRADIMEPVNLLNALREVYDSMGDRDGVADSWLQRRATMPEREVLEAYRSELYTFNLRWRREPSAPKTVRQVIKQDEEVWRRVTEVLQKRGQIPFNKTLRTGVFSQLFEEDSNKLGGLDRYLHLVEEDHERYASEFQASRRS